MASLLPWVPEIGIRRWPRVSFCYRPGPTQLGPEYNLHILDSFAKHVAPALGWKPNTEGPAEGDAV